MKFLTVLIILLIVFAVLIFVTAYICFRLAFFVKEKDKKVKEYDIPPGKEYEPFKETMLLFMKEVKQIPYKDMYITSFDGLRLHAKFYEYEKGAPIEIMFHGYRGNAERDLCGGVQRCFLLGRSVLLVDQRAASKSEGNIISFGVNESKDAIDWAEHIVKELGEDIKIILCGISMGAATVMMAAEKQLPKNVVGILADCGYTTAKEMIIKTIKEMKLPPKLLYPFVKLGAKIFGHFDLEESSPKQALKNCKLPIIFFHGEQDSFVPVDMSIENYNICNCPKKIVTVKGADHGLSYLLDKQGYLKEVAEFFSNNGLKTQVRKSD